MKIKKQLEELLFLLEKSSFKKAHDKCEDLWRKYKNDENTREESYILKAFVNAFAFFELNKMQRYEHSLNIWRIFKKYENLINNLNTQNKVEYKKIQKLIYEKRKEIQI